MNDIDYRFIHPDLKINDFRIDSERLLTLGRTYVKDGEPYMQSIGEFLLNWLDSKDYIEATTSGSTGVPKVIHLKNSIW